MKTRTSPITGRWFIKETELWDRDFLDMLEPAHMDFNKNGLGYFIFGAVQGEMDYVRCERGGKQAVEFTWAGDDDGHEASGRGWAELEEDGTLSGRIFFHMGDNSGFRASSQQED